jgi:hypothetical protein
MIKKSNRHFNLVHMPQIQDSAKKMSRTQRNCSHNDICKLHWWNLNLADNDGESWSDEAWSWKTDFDDASDKNEDKISTDWIQSCLISTSHQFEVLVIAHQDRYVVLSCKIY